MVTKNQKVLKYKFNESILNPSLIFQLPAIFSKDGDVYWNYGVEFVLIERVEVSGILEDKIRHTLSTYGGLHLSTIFPSKSKLKNEHDLLLFSRQEQKVIAQLYKLPNFIEAIELKITLLDFQKSYWSSDDTIPIFNPVIPLPFFMDCLECFPAALCNLIISFIPSRNVTMDDIMVNLHENKLHEKSDFC